MLLAIDELRIVVRDAPQVAPVEDVSLAIGPGQCVALVGESGCGKSLTAAGILRLLPPGLVIDRGRILFDGQDLRTLEESALRRLRGGKIGMVFQDPLGSLNPLFPVAEQIAEVIRTHRGVSRRAAQSRAIELLGEVGIPDPARCRRCYPHELSGGMAQRVGIALAICCEPRLLIADEPTTALDVTIQAQILALLDRLRRRHRMGLLFITHDLALVRLLAERVCVMYAGRIVEHGPAGQILSRPAHPYTQALLETVRATARAAGRLPVIPGEVPTPATRPSGCAFHPRCARAGDDEVCRTRTPALDPFGPERACACHKATVSESPARTA